MDNNTIAGHTQACAIRFNVLASSSSSSGSLSPPAFEDQLARFSIWAANVGAFAEAHGSLDYRLRESPKIKNMMMQLLIGLKRKLQRGRCIIYFSLRLTSGACSDCCVVAELILFSHGLHRRNQNERFPLQVR